MLGKIKETQGDWASVDQVFVVTKGAHEVARLAAKACAAANRGEGKEARKLAAATKEGADRVVESMEEGYRVLGQAGIVTGYHVVWKI